MHYLSEGWFLVIMNPYSHPAQSPPPLQHPVPQHPIQFQQQYQGDFYQSQGGAVPPAQGYMPQQPQAAPYGFFNDPTAQLGARIGMDAFNYGQSYINQNVEKYVNVGTLRYYFQVSNSYVLRKLLLVLFPWRHKPWGRQLQRADNGTEAYAYPRDDLNAPDMYIPIMAFTTCLVVLSIVAGVHGKFHPQLLGLLASKSIAFIVVELILLKFFTYLLASHSKLLDFMAYTGYKFIGVTLTVLVSSIFQSSVLKWGTFLYTWGACAFFMLRSLRFIMLEASTSTSASTVNSAQRQQRIYFLFFYTFVCQLVLMWAFL